MELLQVADTVAREKNIDREIVLEAMEEAIQKAGRSKYGHDHDFRAHIDRKLAALEMYDSQIKLGRPYFQTDFLEGWLRLRGTMIKTQYAEAFEVMRVAW